MSFRNLGLQSRAEHQLTLCETYLVVDLIIFIRDEQLQVPGATCSIITLPPLLQIVGNEDLLRYLVIGFAIKLVIGIATLPSFKFYDFIYSVRFKWEQKKKKKRKPWEPQDYVLVHMCPNIDEGSNKNLLKLNSICSHVN